jgi:hypothetical protein
MPTRERASLAQQPGPGRPCNKPETSSPALATTYDRTAMGTLPAQRGGGMAGIALQGSGYRSDQAQAEMILALQEKASIQAKPSINVPATPLKVTP